MPNIASLLREEFSRLSRREARKQLDAIKRASTQYRRHIAALKRQVHVLERQLSVLAKSVFDGQRTAAPQTDGKTRVRFVAKGLRSQRERLGLSAAEYAKLAGVSAQSIYNWERGAARPRAEQIAQIAALRGLGKRQARARLEQLGANARPNRKRRPRAKARRAQ
jgi:DNA-binding transcriptional regulator YiaG